MARIVTATIGGAEYRLEYDWAALRRMGVERPLDQDQIRGAFGRLEGSMDDIIDAIHAGVRKHHPEVARDALAAAMDYESYGSVMTALAAPASGEGSKIDDPLQPTATSGFTDGSG